MHAPIAASSGVVPPESPAFGVFGSGGVRLEEQRMGLQSWVGMLWSRPRGGRGLELRLACAEVCGHKQRCVNGKLSFNKTLLAVLKKRNGFSTAPPRLFKQNTTLRVLLWDMFLELGVLSKWFVYLCSEANEENSISAKDPFHVF